MVMIGSDNLTLINQFDNGRVYPANSVHLKSVCHNYHINFLLN